MCLFFGSHTALAVTVLRTLLETGVSLKSVVVPSGTRSVENFDDSFPIYRPDNMQSLCEAAGVPLVEVTGVPTLDVLTEPANFVVCVCFPLRLPESILSYPLHGCLNLHPSLLPAYRGPAPTFWQLRAGVQNTGVTLHHMNKTFDAGDIVAQTAVEVPVGISARELDQALGVNGAALIRETLSDPTRKARVQNENDASYFSWPKEEDFEIHTHWSAERVFRFMRGTREMGQPYSISIDDEQFLLESVLMYSAEERLGKSYERFGADMRIQFSPGVVHVIVAESEREKF